MIAISLPTPKRNWETMSFSSTLYLCPILDLLLAKIPPECQPELRLGLQEALVNAAKHGNQLDPSKQVSVKFSIHKNVYSWVISDQGTGFMPTCDRKPEPEDLLPEDFCENGRGLCLLYQIFDQVHWNAEGTQLKLSKQLKKNTKRERFSQRERFF